MCQKSFEYNLSLSFDTIDKMTLNLWKLLEQPVVEGLAYHLPHILEQRMAGLQNLHCAFTETCGALGTCFDSC